MKKNKKWKMFTSLALTAAMPMVAISFSSNKIATERPKITALKSANQQIAANGYVQNLNKEIPYTKSASNVLSTNNRYHAGLNMEVLPFEINGGQVITFNFDRPITSADDITIKIYRDSGFFGEPTYYSEAKVTGSSFDLVGEDPNAIDNANHNPNAPRSDKYFCFIENHGTNRESVTLTSVSSATPIKPVKLFNPETDDFNSFVSEESKTHDVFVIRGQYIDMFFMRDWVKKFWDTEVAKGLRPFKEMMADMESRYHFELNYVGLDNTYDGVDHYGPEKIIMTLEGNGSGDTYGTTDDTIMMFQPAISTFLPAEPGYQATRGSYSVLHELAHAVAPAVPYSSSMGETYAEWFSLETFRIMHGVDVDNHASWFYLPLYFNDDPSIIPPSMTKPLDFNFLGNYNGKTEYNHHQETMFWQLEDAFGPNLFPDLFETLRPEYLFFVKGELRNMYTADWTGTVTKDVWGETQVWNSEYVKNIARIANRDLSSFFTYWKVEMTQEDIDYMHTLPPMTIDLATASQGDQIRILDHDVPKYSPTSMKVATVNKIYTPFVDVNKQTLDDYFTGTDLANVDNVLTFNSETTLNADNTIALPVWLHKSATEAGQTANAYYDTLNVNYQNGVYIPNTSRTPFLKISVENNKIDFAAGTGELNQSSQAIYQYKIELVSSDGASKEVIMINSIDKANDIVNTTLEQGWKFTAGDKLVITPLSVAGFNTFDQNLNSIEHNDAITFNLKSDSLK